MKLIIERNEKEHQGANVTIDTKELIYPYAIREALELALELDGHSEQAIAEVFYRRPNVECKPSEEIHIKSKSKKYKVGDKVSVYINGKPTNVFIIGFRQPKCRNLYLYTLAYTPNPAPICEVVEGEIIQEVETENQEPTEQPVVSSGHYEVGDMIIYEIDGKRDTAFIVSIGLSPHLYYNIAKSLKSTPIARIEFNQIINRIP